MLRPWRALHALTISTLLAIVVQVRSSCTILDHQACDELCKVDNFWYGHCTAWDGKDFSCKCFDYHAPLDGRRCNGMQEHCSRKCQQGGSEGGFCYPQRDIAGKINRTGCECFKELPPLLRRRKRNAMYRRRHFVKMQ